MSEFSRLGRGSGVPGDGIDKPIKKGKPGRPKGKYSDANPDCKRITAFIQKETHRNVKVKLAETDRYLSDVLEELLSEWVNK